MKLLAKTSLYYLIFSIPVLILSGIICYYVITKEVKDSNNELLFNRKILIEHYLKNNDTIPLKLIVESKEAQIDKIRKTTFEDGTKMRYSDTLILDKEEQELAPNRMITAIVSVRSTNYQIKIWRSTLEFNELIEGIFYLLFFILFFLFLVSLLINFWVSKTLWKPFYNSIQNLKSFRASDNKVPAFDKTAIREFKELNNSLITMMDKMILDYTSQKKFTENASHEIQTPLAVIKSKVDLIIQSKNLNENDVELIVAIDDACSKLIRLNKSLLLLTKIENRQFSSSEKVSVEKIMNHSLALFDEHIKSSKIEVIKNIENDFLITINQDLCLILINNLLQNAIRHNIEEGKIIINSKATYFEIYNSGNEKPLNSTLLFKRFQKNSTSHLSTGLGLAIAHEIATVSGLLLEYKFIENNHCFTLIKE